MTLLNDFPVLKNYTYLNTAYSGILSRPIAEWRKQHDADFMEHGSIFRADSGQVTEGLRVNLADTFSVQLQNTYLSQNFSNGFNTILAGLEKSNRFLLLDDDYPSVSYPVLSSGFEVFKVAIDAELEDHIIQAIEKFKPTVFAFSLVQYISGLKMQSDFIKKLKASYPDLLLITDATQYLGTENFNFQQSGIDIMMGSGYKWLLGGYGNGYIFLSDFAKEKLFQGKNHQALPTAPMLQGRDHLSLSLEPGHLDSLNLGTLNQGLNYLKNVGLDTISQAIESLTAQARVALYDKGLQQEWMLQRKEQSGILSLPLKADVVKRLEENQVLCSPRGAGTRISIHFYNTEKDLQQLLLQLD